MYAIRSYYGFLDVTLADATLTVDPTVQLDVALVDGSGDNRIRLDELATALVNPTALAGMVDFDVTGAAGDDVEFDVEARVAALIPGQAAPFDLGAARVNLTWADIA